MTTRFKPGDHVGWNCEAGPVSGHIIRIQTSDFDDKDQSHHASEANPQHEIHSDRTDHIAARRSAALHLLLERKLCMTFPLARTLLSAVLLAGGAALPAQAEDVDMVAIYAAADRQGQTGTARKTRIVDARPATPGEVIVTVIAGEGVETQSKPAEAGDYVVRNRCPATGNEEYLVKAARFAERYAATGETLPDGWAAYTPAGQEMGYFLIPEGEGPYSFTAPWGEPMVALAGDAIVRNPDDETDVYRVAAASFDCTYEITRPAP